VNLQDLNKQLRTEITAHPRKAVILLIMMVVGLCFWAPRFYGWLNASTAEQQLPAGDRGQTATTSEHNGAGDRSIANKESKPSQHRWKEVLKWINNDPRTSPAPPLAEIRDPFHVRKALVEKSVVEEPATVKPVPVSPTSLGMSLTSTVIWQNGGIARIGGKMYSLGRAIEITKEGHSYKFVLTEIQDRRVVLEMEGEKFELNIPEPGASSHMIMGTVAK
jgi:hypothetical protein